MASTGLSEVFTDQRFWYNLDVDYEEAESEAETGDGADDEDDQNLADVLLDQFEKRKQHIIEEEYDSTDDFREKIKDGHEPRHRLMKIYTKYLWSQKKDGEQFETANDTDEKLADISGEQGTILENVDDNFRVLWPSEETIDREIDEEENEVFGEKYQRAKPVIVKKSDDGFEVRGRARDKRDLLRQLRKDSEVEEKEPEQVSESIAEEIEELLTEENQFFKIVGMEFAESELPGNSELKVKNDDSIYNDVEALKQVGLISLQGMSEIKKLYIQDKETGNKFRIAVEHQDQGFKFELVAPRKLDSERERFKNNFESATDITFDKLYDYSSQADERYLVNKILAESSQAYNKYYEELSDGAQDLIDELVETTEEKRKICQGCGNQVETDDDECDDCGNDDFFEPVDRTVLEVDDEDAFAKVYDEIENAAPDHEKLSIQDLEIEKDSFGSGESKRPVALASFHGLDIESDVSTTSYSEVYFVPLGNRRRPQQLDDYLLESVLITFGGSRTTREEGFGHLSLYDVLLNDDEDVDDIVGKAIYDALIGVTERILKKSREARETGTTLLREMDRVADIGDHREELAEIYKSNKFEKHVYYLLRELFPFSERMGKEGKRQPDSVLICPQDDNFYVATCDAKLSYRTDGYDINSSEEDKATRYIRSAAQNERILNKTNDTGPSAHLFISQNFKSSQFERVSENIDDNLSDSDDASIDTVKIVFFEFQALLDLFKFYEKYWNYMNKPAIRSKFQETILEELRDDRDYIHFNADAVANIRETVLGRIDTLPDGDITRYSE